MLQLALRTLRYRAGLFAATFLAMFFAATMMMASGGLIETGLRAAVEPQQLRSADIVVAGDQKYHGSGGDEDEPPILPERVRVDADLEAVLAALPGVREVETFVFEPAAPSGTVDALGVVAQDGTDPAELRALVDAELDATTVSLVGDERGRAELRDAAGSGTTVVAMAGVFTAFALLVSVFGIASTLALSIAQRRRDLALLRAVGATGRQLRQLVLRETLLLSVLATAAAIVPGQLAGRFVHGLLIGQGIVADGLVFHQGWIPTAAAMVVATAAAVVGALSAGRRAARIAPMQALAEASVDAGCIGTARLILALAFLGGGIALTIVTVTVMDGPLMPATGAPAVLLLALGSALLAPVLASTITFVLQWPVRALGGVTGELAVLNARGRSSRTGAVMAPVILLTAVATGLLYLQSTNDEADRRLYSQTLVADAVVTGEDGLDPDLVERIDDLPGVEGASEHVGSLGFIEDPVDASPASEGWSLLGVTAAGAAATTPVSVVSGDLDDLQEETLALGRGHAERLGVGLGDAITVRMGDNTALDLRVVATFEAPEGYDTLLLPADTLAEHTTDGAATRILVAADGDTGPERLDAELSALTASEQGITVSGRDVLFAEYDAQKTTANVAIRIMVVMVAGYAAITVINTLASSMIARRREFGLQRLAGSTRDQVMRMIAVEGAIIAFGGVLIGTLAAASIVVPISVERLGSALPAGSPFVYLATIAFAGVVTLGAVLVPTWRATRGRPAEAALAVD